MRKTYITILLLLATFLSAQQPEITIEDFNQDGVQDTLECFKEWGSNFGGVDCKIKDGKSQKEFELSYYGCYCQMKDRVLIAPELRETRNAPFLLGLRNKMLPPLRSSPDASLKWIIASSYRTSKPKGDSYFDFIFDPKIKWQKGEMEFPTSHTIEMRLDSLSRIIPEANDTIVRHKTERDYLVYHGKTHLRHDRIQAETTEFAPATHDQTYQILKTMHGVLVKKGNLHKWLFVTDMHSNSSPQKLRWESIQKVILLDGYIVIKQSLAPDSEYALYMINIEKGIGGRVTIDFDTLLAHDIEFLDLDPTERFSIKDNTILIGNEIKTIRLPLEEIKNNLDSFYKSE